MKKETQLRILIAICVIIWIAYTSKSSSEPADTASANTTIVSHSRQVNTLDGYNVFCTVRNETDKLASSITVEASFYDNNGTIVGTGTGTAYNVPAHETRPLTIRAVDIFNGVSYNLNVKWENYHD